MKALPILPIVLLTVNYGLLAQSASSSQDADNQPRVVTYCDLAKDPAHYNHALVQITAFVTRGFENFQLSDPSCGNIQQHFSVWLMYGGTTESGTAYCCPGEAGQETRSHSLQVDGIDVPLVNDGTFQHFQDLLKREADTSVRATLVGRFFSGAERKTDRGTFWSGYGHLGCCSLSAVKRVQSFEPHVRNDVDYSAEAGWYEPEGCKYSSLRYVREVSLAFPGEGTDGAIREQHAADASETWRFTQPERVALESLNEVYGAKDHTLKTVKATQVRQVFRWREGKKLIVVVVTRPYWLSFYSASQSVAWVSTNIREVACR